MFSGVSKWGFSFLIVLFYSFFIGFIRFLVVLGFSFRNFFPLTFVPCICTTYYCIFVCFFFFFVISWLCFLWWRLVSGAKFSFCPGSAVVCAYVVGSRGSWLCKFVVLWEHFFVWHASA